LLVKTKMVHYLFNLVGSYRHTIFPEMECWTELHILHGFVACLASLIFLSISIVVALTYFECAGTSNDPSARVNSRTEVFEMVSKIIFNYLFTFFGKPQYQWVLIAVLLTFSTITYYKYRYNWPYYSPTISMVVNILSGLFVWTNLVLLIAKVLEDSEFKGALQIFFLGIPMIFLLILTHKDERVALLMKNINNFQKGEEVAIQIRYFLHLVQSKDANRNNAILLKGYVYFHEDQCPLNECVLKTYKKWVLDHSQNKKQSGKKYLQLSQNFDMQQILFRHADNMFKVGIQKFPNCTSLKMSYAFFLMHRLKKVHQALEELTNALEYSPPFDEQFIIFRYRRYCEESGYQTEASGSSHQGSSSAQYETSFRQLQNMIERSAQLHLEFWNYLREDRPDIAKLNECGAKINTSIGMVEQQWTALQKINSNVPKALRMYAKFLIEILNDKDSGQELLSRAKDATNIKQNYENHVQQDLSDISAMSSDGTPCIYIYGNNNENLGVITQCNAGALRLFGYTIAEVKNHNVKKLMPEMYAKNHTRVLEKAILKGPDGIPNKERMVFAKHKSGYLFPVWLQLKAIQTQGNNLQFVALFKTDKKIISSNIGFILISKQDKKIAGISSSCIKLLDLDIQKVKKLTYNGIDMTYLMPALF